MIVMNKLSRMMGGLHVVLLLALSGCAHNETAVGAPAPVAAKEEKKPEKASAIAVSIVEEKLPDYENMNPVPIAFEKLSVKLRESDKQILVRIKDRAKKAHKLVITGYCDRQQVGNSKAAAIARAVAVKDELVRMGVKPGVVRIKHVTDVANKHAAEVEMLAST